MTVSSTIKRNDYTGNGSNTIFPYQFKVFASTELEVYLDGVLQASGYTVSGVGNDAGGNVTFTTAPASGVKVTLLRKLPLTQPTDLPTQGPLSTTSVENQLDRLVMLTQQLQEQFDRALLLVVESTLSGLTLTPEASTYLQWNATANGITNVSSVTPSTTTVTSFMETLLDDATAGAARQTLAIPLNDLLAKTTAYTVVAADNGRLITCSGNFTLTLLSAATAGADFTLAIANIGTNLITIDPNAAETINRDATLVLGPDESAILYCDGTNWLIAGLTRRAFPKNHIAGLTLSNGTDTDHDTDIAVGECRDDADSLNISVATILTKQIDAAWAVGHNAGGLDTGAVAADSIYAIWLIERPDTGVVDAIYTLSFATPLMPTNYTIKRLIGAVVTNSSANIIGFVQSGDYFRFTGDVITDVNDSAITPATFTPGTLSVPPNALAHIYGLVLNTTSTSSRESLWIRTKDAADAAINQEAWLQVGVDANFDQAAREGMVLVNGSRQIEYAAEEVSGAAAVVIHTFGFMMFTRSNP